MIGCGKILTDDYFCGAFFRGGLRLCDECKEKERQKEIRKLEQEKLRLEIEKLKKELKREIE